VTHVSTVCCLATCNHAVVVHNHAPAIRAALGQRG
jgi:predicted metal-binding protein